MRIWFGGPRIMGLRTGVSFGPEDLRAARQSCARTLPNPNGTGFVYVIRGAHGLVKIGMSTNPNARLAHLRTASPFPLDFEAVTAVSANAFGVEQEAHRLLAGNGLEGEWFDCPPEIALTAIERAAGNLGVRISQVRPEDIDRIVAIANSPAEAFEPPRRMGWLTGMASFVVFIGAVGLEIASSAGFIAVALTFAAWCFFNAMLSWNRT